MCNVKFLGWLNLGTSRLVTKILQWWKVSKILRESPEVLYSYRIKSGMLSFSEIKISESELVNF